MTASVVDRLDAVELRLHRLERELSELRAVRRHEPVAAPAPPPPPVEPPPFYAPPSPRAPTAPASKPKEPRYLAPPAPREQASRRSLEDILEQLDLVGARGLAVAGGVVMLLGIAFFFVLAANRGWIGPVARVSLGTVASAAAFACGVVLRHRFGQLHAAVAAVAVGIAGGYTTLLAGAALYDLVPEAAALVLAAAIAALGLAIALVWSAELLAALGLVGAIALAALDALDSGSTAIGVAFVAIMLAAAGGASVARRWPWLLGAAALVAAPQALALAAAAEHDDAGAIAACASVAAVLLAAGAARQLREGADELDPLAGSLTLGSTGLTLACALLLLPPGDGRGVALLVAAAAPAVAAIVSWRRARDLSAVAGGCALALAAVGTADLVSASTLTVVWSAQSILLTVLGARLRLPRLRLAGLVYLPLALVHCLAIDAPLGRLFDDANASLASGTASVAALSGAFLVAGLAGRFRRDAETHGLLRPVAQAIDALVLHHRLVRDTLAGAGILLALYAAALLLVDASFANGHVAVTMLWAATGLAAVALGAWRGSERAWTVGLCWLAVVLVKNATFDWPELGHARGATALLVVAGSVLLAGFALRVLSRSQARLTIVSGVCATVALLSFSSAIGALVENPRVAAAPMAGVAMLYIGLAATVFRSRRLRDLATVLWANGLVALLVTEALLLQDRGIVLAFAATAAGLALLARPLGEDRLWYAGALVLGGTTLTTLAALTPPGHLLEASAHPGRSAWALAACVGAAVVLALTGEQRREPILGIAAALGVYTLSLAILELAERVSGASVQTDFERGHTAVSALWGLIGLGLVVAGLLRRSAALRLGGFALFGLALAKLFLYDLSALSSITRALSFLAVGAFLLAGGFFLQRLSARVGRPNQLA